MDDATKQRAIKHLNWMISDIDFRNSGLVERTIGLESVEDSEQMKDARALLKELKNGTE